MSKEKLITINIMRKLARAFISSNFVYSKDSFLFTKELHTGFSASVYNHFRYGKDINLQTGAWIEKDTIKLFQDIYFGKDPY